MRAIAMLILSLLLTGVAHATSLPEAYFGANTFSPVCMVQGVAEADKRHALQKSICDAAVAIKDPQKTGTVEAISLGDQRIIEPDRLIFGITARVTEVNGATYITFAAKTYRFGMQDGSIVPTPPTLAPFDGTITPAVTAALAAALP